MPIFFSKKSCNRGGGSTPQMPLNVKTVDGLDFIGTICHHRDTIPWTLVGHKTRDITICFLIVFMISLKSTSAIIRKQILWLWQTTNIHLHDRGRSKVWNLDQNSWQWRHSVPSNILSPIKWGSLVHYFRGERGQELFWKDTQKIFHFIRKVQLFPKQ